MAKTGIPRSPKIYLTLFIFFLLLTVMMPRTGNFNYDYKKGSPWVYETLISQIDFPVLKTREQLQSERDAAGTKVVPYYRFSDESEQNAIREAGTLNLGTFDYMRSQIMSSLATIYQRGIMGDDVSTAEDNVSPTDDVIFVQKDKHAAKMPASDVYTASSARAKLVSDLSRSFPGVKVDSVLTASGVFDAIAPNLLYDKETTDLVHAESVDFISPTQGFVTAGQLIVTKGEIVTAEIEQLLDSYKAEYETSLATTVRPSFSGPEMP